MGKRKGSALKQFPCVPAQKTTQCTTVTGSWRKFFCCTGPPETQSSTCVNIGESDHVKPPPDPELEQEDEDLYIEAEVQTSNVEIPEGNRWRWSRLHNEVEVQTSSVALPVEAAGSASEMDAQIQTSFLSLPREAEAQAQTSFLSLQSAAPFETEAQVQTSFAELPRESCTEAQVQTSLLSLPQEREAEVQTSFLSLPEKQSVISIQVQPSYLEVLEKIASLPMLVETQVQTSDLEMPPSEADIQVQTSFSDYMSEKEETSSIETEQQSKRSSSQLSEMDFCTLYPLYIDAEAQTLPVEIPPGNDWRSARLKAAAQVQTSNISLEKPVPLPQGVIQVHPSKLTLQKSEMLVEELEAPLSIKEKSPPSKPIEIGIQTSSPENQGEDKRSSSQQSMAQFQPSTLELLKKLSLLSQIETVESSSRTELLKKVSSLSVTDTYMQTSSCELQRKPSSLSDSATQDQVLNVEPLKKRPASAHVPVSLDSEATGKLHPPSTTKEVQTQTSDLELMKKLLPSSHMESRERISDADLHKYSSLSLVEAMDGDQAAVTEGREYLVTPQLIEAQIRKWYHEFPEVQTASQAPVQRGPLLSPTVDREVQTSSVEIPQGNRWRASRLQADAEVQISGLESAVEEVKPCHQSWDDTQTQTSLLEMWQARDLADAQIQTSDWGLARTEVEHPPPLLINCQVQTSLVGMGKANEKADVQTQTSVNELPKQVIESPPTQQIDRLMQTSLLEICKTKEPDSVEQKAPEFLENSPLQTDLEVQTSLTDMWRGKDTTDIQVQASLLEIPDVQEEPPLLSQTDAVVQTSDVEIPEGSKWRSSRLQADVELQTSLLEIPDSQEELPLLSQTNAVVQTSDVKIPEGSKWRSSRLQADVQLQTSLLEIPDAQEEPPLLSQTDAMVQTSDVEIPEGSKWRSSRLQTDVQLQTSMLDMEAELEPVPASQKDTPVQTSLLDIWKTKDLRDARAQTSGMDVSPPLEEPPLSSQPENVVQPPSSGATESSPPSQIDTEVQTSFPDLGKRKDVSDSLAQTSQLDISKSVEELLPPPQLKNIVQSPAPETVESPLPSQADNEAQTSFFDIWKAKELSNGQVQTSWPDVPKSMEEPLLQLQSESPIQTVTPESPSLNQLDPEKQVSLLEMWKAREPVESPDLPRSSQSPTDTKAQTSQLDMQTLEARPSAPVLLSKTDTAGTTLESAVPSRTASPVRLPVPADMEVALFGHTDPQLLPSLLEVWTTRQEAEVQMQTANLGLSFDKDSPLFPMLLEGQEEKKLEQVSKVEGKSKPLIFTEAQVQTSFVEIPQGKKWRSSRLCTEAQVQTSFPDLRSKDRMPALQKMVSDHVSAKRVQKGPKRATPVSVHLHVKMSPKRRTSNEKKE